MILGDLLEIRVDVIVKIMVHNKSEFLKQGFSTLAYFDLEGFKWQEHFITPEVLATQSP